MGRSVQYRGAMTGNPKRTKIAGFWRHVLAENVAALMERKYHDSSN